MLSRLNVVNANAEYLAEIVHYYASDLRLRRFAESLEKANEVKIYAKLPRGFQIPTPVGNYAPDWAIVFNEGMVKHIYFM